MGFSRELFYFSAEQRWNEGNAVLEDRNRALVHWWYIVLDFLCGGPTLVYSRKSGLLDPDTSGFTYAADVVIMNNWIFQNMRSILFY